MNENYSGLLRSSFNRTLGPISTVGSIVLALIFWYFLPGQSVQLAVVLPILIILVIIIFALSDAIYEMIKINAKDNEINLPKIIISRKEQNSDYISCLLEPSKLFSEDIAVSFYYAPPGSFEVQIGVGHVRLIQTDKKIQVLLIQQVDAYAEIVSSLANNNEIIKKDIYIKPTIQKSYLLGNGG